MGYTFAGGALHLRLCGSQCLSGRILIAAGNRSLHLLDEGSHARLTRLIALSACLGLPDALSRGRRVGHVPLSLAETEKPRSLVDPGERSSSMLSPRVKKPSGAAKHATGRRTVRSKSPD